MQPSTRKTVLATVKLAPTLLEGPTIAQRVGLLARDIKLSHSIFALPFALLAMFLAAGAGGSGEAGGRLPSVIQCAILVLCMVLARTVAMTVNRWADAAFDADNPRTAGRAIPSGRLSTQFMLGAAIGCGICFIAVTSGFWLLDNNPWPLILGPLVLAYLAAYSFTKRFTWLCHLALGGALAMSPLAAVIAIEPAYLGKVEPFLLALVVICWVAGFDIIYALQDVGIDRRQGLFSMPADLGVEPALWVSRTLHLAAAVALWGLWRAEAQLGALFAIAVAATVGLLVVEHALVWGSRTHRIPVAFFAINGVISLLLGAMGIADVVRVLNR